MKMKTYLACFFVLIAATLSAKQKNIVLLMSDDIGFECFTSFGGQDYKMPNFDKLCKVGTRFENCYSQPLCTPSRVKIMTGKCNFRNYERFEGMREGERTFANLLKDAGYKTAVVGKWQLGMLSENPDNPRKFGFDTYCLWAYNGKGHRYWNPIIYKDGEFLNGDGKFGPDVMCDAVCDLIRSFKNNGDEPFFIYYPMLLTHDPYVPTPDSSADLKAAYSKLLEQKAAEGKDISPTALEFGFKEDKVLRKRAFSDMAAYLDKNIGRIYKTLKDEGLLDDTIFIYTSDNGTHPMIKSLCNNMEIIGGKGSMRNMGTHVPLLFVGGKAKKDFVSKDLIDFSDVYPTLAEIAGVKIGEGEFIDGRSFYGSTQGKADNPRTWIVCNYNSLHFNNSKGDRYVRTVDYKLYEDGRFFRPANDLYEKKTIKEVSEIPEYNFLKEKIKKLPPLDRRGLEDLRNAGESFKSYPNWPGIYD